MTCTRIVENGNRARFSHKGGEHTFHPFLVARFLTRYPSVTGVGTETNATSVTKPIKVSLILSCLRASFSRLLVHLPRIPALVLCPPRMVNYTSHLHT